MNINDIPFKVGCDPEFALYSEAEKRYVPAIGLIPGTKENPFELEKGSCQVDGTVLEIGIDPAKTQKDFVTNIRTVLLQVRDILPPDITIKCGTYIRYEKDILKDIPASAFISGCDKQYSLLTGSDINTVRLQEVHSSASRDFVTLGGHVHIGFCEGEDITDKYHLLDCYAIMMEFTRRFRITRPNAYRVETSNIARIKPYGIEVRSPDSTWLRNETSIRSMHSFCKNVVMRVLNNNHRFDLHAPLNVNGPLPSIVGRAA